MKTISKVFDTYGQARQAVADLESAGIAHSEISLVANKHVSAQYDDVDASGTAAGAGVGAALGGGAGLLAGLGLLAIPGIGPVVAAGWLASTALGAAAGAAAGGLLGALTDAGVPRDDAEVYSEAVRRGGTLVSVRADERDAGRVDAILARHQPIDPVSRRADYTRAGWTGYDPSAEPYALSESERERIRRPYSV